MSGPETKWVPTEGKKYLRRLRYRKKDIIKMDIKQVVMIWPGFIWPGIESSGALLRKN
jgi:hypothetical protein